MLENMNCSTGGILRKSHPKSRFVYRDMNNGLYEFDAVNPCVCNYEDDPGTPIVVLQVMLCDTHNVLIEYVRAEDFE